MDNGYYSAITMIVPNHWQFNVMRHRELNNFATSCHLTQPMNMFPNKLESSQKMTCLPDFSHTYLDYSIQLPLPLIPYSFRTAIQFNHIVLVRLFALSSLDDPE